MSHKDLSPAEVMEKLFEDFDGTYVEQNSSDGSRQNLSDNGVSIPNPNVTQGHLFPSQTSIPVIGTTEKSQTELGTGDQMVYYPAPVPSMLNLPPRQSKKPPSAPQYSRKSHMMSSDNMSQDWTNFQSHETGSGTEVAGKGQDFLSPQPMTNNLNTSRQLSNSDPTSLPPQIRANNFFEKLNQTSEVFKLKDQSAVATLESILDASAHAPVYAFTDHTFAGALGPEVYGKKKIPKNRQDTTQNDKPKSKRSSSFMFLGGRNSKSKDAVGACQDQTGPIENNNRQHDDDNPTTTYKDTGAIVGPASEEKDPDETHLDHVKQDELSSDGERDDEMYQGPPTTLLAELQLRKQRQKERTQPLTKTFPNGIHSTLLELDTAIQTEQRTRRKGRTILAWEDPSAAEVQEAMEDNDDVPLAMLYSDKTTDNYPLSLLEQRALEDSEPLSQRRSRLQGRLGITHRTVKSSNKISLPNEPEEESLRERLKRLKASALPHAPAVSSEFQSQLLEKFENNSSDPKSKTIKKNTESSTMPEEEETLGQRRKRLQAVNGSGAREIDKFLQVQQPVLMPDLKSRKSIAGILSAHPIGNGLAPLNYEKPTTGLLALHEKHAALRTASMLSLNKLPTSLGPMHAQQKSLGNFRDELHNENHRGIITSKSAHYVPNQTPSSNFPKVSMGNSGPTHPSGSSAGLLAGLGMGTENVNQSIPSHLQGYMKNVAMMPIKMASPQPIKPGQVDMIERWRQSIMPLNKSAT